MRNRASIVAVVGLIAIGTALFGAAPASAETTWTVAPGGSVSVSGGPFTIYSSTGTVLYRCSAWGTDGQFQSGTGLPGAGIGTLVRSFFSSGGCSGQFAISIQPGWPVNVTSYRSDRNWALGTIDVRIVDSSPLHCSDGFRAAPFIYDNNTGELSSNVFWPVAGIDANACVVALGRSVVSPRQTITSP